jgi:hypothetical protein
MEFHEAILAYLIGATQVHYHVIISRVTYET